eukprot:scaffold126041_cov15-Tisochrysis_lutea.AAC.1
MMLVGVSTCGCLEPLEQRCMHRSMGQRGNMPEPTGCQSSMGCSSLFQPAKITRKNAGCFSSGFELTAGGKHFKQP